MATTGDPELDAYLASLAPDPYWQTKAYVDTVMAKPVLDTSPEWQAYINALGLTKKQFASDIARQESLQRSQAQFQTESLRPQYDQQRRGITGNAEGRGMARSGQLQRNLAENKATQGRQNAAIQQALQANISNLEGSLANKNVELEAQQMQQRGSMLAAGYRTTTGNPELDRYLAGLKPTPVVKTTTGNPELDAYLASL